MACARNARVAGSLPVAMSSSTFDRTSEADNGRRINPWGQTLSIITLCLLIARTTPLSADLSSIRSFLPKFTRALTESLSPQLTPSLDATTPGPRPVQGSRIWKMGGQTPPVMIRRSCDRAVMPVVERPKAQ